jgi:RNA polymerase sigma-70 factor, ECF subfamily
MSGVACGGVACAPQPVPRGRERDARAPEGEPRLYLLDPDSLSRHIDRLFRAAWALCGCRHDAEDLVQETFVNVLKRPRWLRNRDEIGYLLRALRNTYNSRYRSAAQRPRDRQLLDSDLVEHRDGEINARELMEAIASAPAHYRDAVIAIDLVGLSYREAARSLRTREATITTRVHRGRQYVARALLRESPAGA